MIILPDIEQHRLYHADGLTRYSLQDILAAAAEVEVAMAEYNEAADLLDSSLRPHREGPLQLIYDEHYQQLELLLDSSSVPSDFHGSAAEAWPVKKWRRHAATYRAAAQRIRRALKGTAT